MADWKIKITGIHTLQERQINDEITFEQMRDGVVKILRYKLARYLREPNLDESLDQIIDELSFVDSTDYYNSVKDALYDWCDANLVWIDPTC